ncbi:MAG: TadE family protein [Carboxydocellales bacterium]
MMLKLPFKKVGGERGQAMVEMALVLPVLILLIFGIVEFGRVFNAYLIVTNAAREGARAGVVGVSDSIIHQTVESAAPTLNNLLLNVTITPSSTYRTRGSALTTEVEYPVKIYAPVISNIIGNPYVIKGKSTMRVE